VFEFQRDFRKIYDKLKIRNKFPVVCGGSGMYIDSILTGYKMFEVPPDSGLRAQLEKKSIEELKEILSSFKELHNTTDVDTKKRVIRAIEIEHFNRSGKHKQTSFPPLNSIIVGISCERDIRRKRISERLRKRLGNGMIDEVKGLIDNGVPPETLIYYGLEYKYITLYLTDKMDYDLMVRNLEVAIHQFAKRQMTWFRGMEKKGTKIHWIDSELPIDLKIEKIMNLISDKSQAI
jgi:tRNA dimethylallyltransferase